VTTHRAHSRVTPSPALTVAIEDDLGLCLGYGVIANVSEAGACVWTNRALPAEALLNFRVSFCRPAEVHDIAGTVVWEGKAPPSPDAGSRCFGVKFRDAASPCVLRLREVVQRVEEEARLTPASLSALRAARLGR
jgi:hypothetical protein